MLILDSVEKVTIISQRKAEAVKCRVGGAVRFCFISVKHCLTDMLMLFFMLFLMCPFVCQYYICVYIQTPLF